MQQGSDEWKRARLGLVTASRIADVMAKTKSGYGAQRANYMAQLICETLTGEPQDGFQSEAMRWGIATEPLARTTYEMETGSLVDTVGVVLHMTLRAGASPDGLIDPDGLIEIKCPQTATHLDTLLNDTIPKKYILQMQWQMECTNRLWCDFYSFDPRLPEKYNSYCKRIEKDDKLVSEICEEVEKFNKEMDEKLADLKARYEKDI